MKQAAVTAFFVAASYLFSLGIAFGCLALALLFAIHPSVASFFVIPFGVVACGIVLWSLIPRAMPFQVPGILLDPEQQPELIQELRSICSNYRLRMPNELYLTPDANSFVAEPNLLFGKRRVLGMGLFAFQTLTVAQFRAVLAHEFAHFYAGDTWLGPWLYQSRNAVGRIVSNLTGNKANISKFLGLYVRLFHAGLVRVAVAQWRFCSRRTMEFAHTYEYRCDELACIYAGSASMSSGLQTSLLSQSLARQFWTSNILPLTTAGYLAPIAEGFQFQFDQHCGVNRSRVMEIHLAGLSRHPSPTHPPPDERVLRMSGVHAPETSTDHRPAISLLRNVPDLELTLARLVLRIPAVPLAPLAWDEVGTTVYQPRWRNSTNSLAAFFGAKTLRDVPDLLSHRHDLESLLVKITGKPLSAAQQKAAAISHVSAAVFLGLANAGWTIQAHPSKFCCTKGDTSLHPDSLIRDLLSGKMTADQWRELMNHHNTADALLLVPTKKGEGEPASSDTPHSRSGSPV